MRMMVIDVYLFYAIPFILKVYHVESACDHYLPIGSCSKTCGQGEQVYANHRCESGWIPIYGCTDQCFRETKTEPCVGRDGCQGIWSGWERYGTCSVTCGTGRQAYQRRCDNPSPGNDGKYCVGDSIKYMECYTGGCPGSWGCWYNIGHCNAACGNGTQLRVRDCNNPAPSDNGPYCQGDNTTKIWCNIKECPVFKWGHLKELNMTKTEIAETMKEELAELKSNLTIDNKNTSSAIRRRTSARDERQSAATFGYFGIAMLCIPIILMCCFDCTRLFNSNDKALINRGNTKIGCSPDTK